MEMMRQQNRIGELFKRIDLKDKSVLDLSSLTIEGEVVTNPVVIHGKLTELFRRWYQIPDNLHREARKFWERDYWRLLAEGRVGVEDTSVFDESFRIRLFQKACISCVSQEQRRVIENSVLLPISEEEYWNEIRGMPYGKAPGPSGVTANMIKDWPEKIHVQVLEWLNQIWYNKSPPSWWYIGHLRPIPKPGEQSLENLRPLGLYEITRKILTAIIIRRIYNHWEGMQLLNANQHAFRRGLSTTNAIMRLLNVAEDAEEWESPLGLVLWDFRRAFDSIDYNFTRLALFRLGVPDLAMEFMLGMMENNVMAVASPYHLSQHEENGCIGEYFHQERGTGQGDPPSPIIWIAVFDVLLSMLSAEDSDGAYYAHGKASEVYKANDIAYADDLVTISASNWSQQHKADIVSTFCACTGMTIAAVKVRVFQLNWKETNDLVIYDSLWQPTWLEPKTEQLLIKYLGFMLGHRMEDEEAFKISMGYLREAVMHVSRCHAPIQVKMDIYRMQIVPKLLYMASKAAWDIKQYRKMDAIAARLLKVIGGQMMTSSSLMMFLPQDECGSGLQLPSDLAQARKWTELVRVLGSNTESANAANGLLERALRQMALNAPPTARRSLVPDNRQFLKGCINSLVAWGDEVGCLLSQSASYEYSDGNAPILPYVDAMNKQVLRDVQKCDLTVQGELVQRNGEGTKEWIPLPWCNRIRAELADNLIMQPDDSGVLINTGQMYIMNDEYLEVIGKIHDSGSETVLCLRWQEHPQNIQCLWRPMDGLAVRCARLSSDFINVTRLIVKVVATTRESERLMVKIISRSRGVSPSCGVSIGWNISGHILQFAQEVASASLVSGVNYHLYTDGSHNMKLLPKEAVLNSTAKNAREGRISASIVAVANDEAWRERKIMVLYVGSSEEIIGMQAYIAELVALLVAVRVSNASGDLNIYSDCKAAIDTVKRFHAKSGKENQFCNIRPILGLLEHMECLPCIEWIPSHPERRLEDVDLWQAHDWGSYLADMVAKGQIHRITQEFNVQEGNIFTISMDDAVSSLIAPGTWYWRRTGSKMPILQPLIQLHNEQRSSIYFQSRDAYRLKRGEDGHWVGSSLALAAKCWKQIASGVFGSNIALKNCLDKYYHGRNREGSDWIRSSAHEHLSHMWYE